MMPVSDVMASNRYGEEHRRDLNPIDDPRSERGARPATPREEAPATSVDTASALEPLRKALETLGKSAEVSYREDIQRVVVLIHRLDPESGEKLEEISHQIPPEEVLRLAQRLREGRSTIFDDII
jgi:uncharacterized FlaG/YvyC family protein